MTDKIGAEAYFEEFRDKSQYTRFKSITNNNILLECLSNPDYNTLYK
jgi:hypothetical protein